MTNALPVALILFSNDMDNFLHMVERERKMIEEALEHFNDHNRLKVITRSSVSVEEIFRLFNKYRGRIVLFHFAGHANGDGLQLNQDFKDANFGNAEGIAGLFQQEVENGILQLVFLNGCSTNPQLELLREIGVPHVISTHHPIEDKKAVVFAKQFYEFLANTGKEAPFKDLPTIEQSFQHATSYLKTVYQTKENVQHRSLLLQWDLETPTETWTLYSKNTDWRLSLEATDDQKAFNETLTLQLIEALHPHSKLAQNLLKTVKAKGVDEWESSSKWADPAKVIITRSYVGILGIQLRKLFAIGKEPHSDKKLQQYLLNCVLTCKRILQLLTFTMLSRLWDHQQEKGLNLSDAHKKVLKHFFDSEFELDIQDYTTLCHTIFEVFGKAQAEFPIDELKAFDQHFEEEAPFLDACNRLQQLHQKLDKAEIVLADCFAAERQLAYVLKRLSFLANYRMVSIKHIDYVEMRNSAPKYLHSFAALGIDKKLNVNSEKVNYVDAPINTDAVLLYKGRYQQSINLFPFIIDYHALTFENGSKICFYHGQNFNDGSLNFSFLEDNSIVSIVNHNTHEGGDDLNQLMMDQAKRTKYKLDFVWLQFKEAKKALIGESEEEEIDLLGGDEDEFEF